MIFRVCSVSGGKDSTALYIWMINKFGKDGFRAVVSDTDHEHDVTVNYWKNLQAMAGGPEVEIVRSDFSDRVEPSGNLFLDMMLWKGRAPSTKAQFCTEHMKLVPIRDWVNKIRGDSEVIMYTGIRAGESPKRAKMQDSEYLEFFDCITERPLLRWTEEEVFAYLEKHNVPANPLYEAGFERVGCHPCIHARKSELALLENKYWEKIANWETRIGRSWFAFGTLPLTPEQRHEINKLPRSKEDQKKPEPVAYGKLLKAHPEWMPTVAQVREWSKTVRGGRQFDLFAEDAKDIPSCMSTWGVCE